VAGLKTPVWGAIQMKRPLQLPLAIALALSGTDALALGLGTIHVNSKLNQPLDAEIPILQGTAGEAEGLLVQLAAAEDFDRVGLNRSRVSVPLEFSLVKGAHGDLVIKVTSKEVVREPFLDFLVEANWPKGRLLREYTVLLDPPVMAPASGAAVTAAAKPQERAPTQALPEAKPKAPAKPAPAAPIAAAPRQAPAPKAAPAAPAPKHAAASGEYTVEAGDTLSGVARDMRPDESTNINQMMLALLKQNPNAFYKDNINALKRGSILRIPSTDQIKAVGSASEAAAEVHTQIEDWRGGAAAKPTLVADTGTQREPKPKTPAAKTPTGTSTTTSTAKTGSERLALVPPKAGKDSVAMADRPGSGAGSAGGSTELKSELARTKEALTSREQEAGELKSRVKELEDTKGKSDRLLSLKDSEIADLQRKLKELQDQGTTGSKPATTTSTTPATSSTSTTPPTTPAAGASKTDKVSKEDIWGTAGTTPETKTPPATTSTTPSPTTTTPATSASTTTPPASSTTPPSTAGSSTTSTTPSTTTPAATATTGATATPSTPSSTSPTPDTTTASTTSPSATATPPVVTTTPPPAKPVTAATTPIKPEVKTKTQPLAPAWYEDSWVKPAAIGAAALLLLAGLLGMRKRKAAAVMERGSIAGAFGDSPLRDGDAIAMPETEEQVLRDQLMLDPRNLGLYLELLSVLYSERNAEAFEHAAEAMHVHVVDMHQPEWLEAKAMGQELAPHNPLFGDSMPAHDVFDDEGVTAPHVSMFDHDEVFNRREPLEEVATRANTAFDFDLDPDVPAPQAPVPPPSEAAFSFDNIAPLDFGKEAQHEVFTAIAPAPLQVDEDEFPGEDGVGTKLDLAKAYLDMGDPEGARSMLEEVLAEGNDTQKGEAQRLMAEIK
jgi:pilus assembly protein FimV